MTKGYKNRELPCSTCGGKCCYFAPIENDGETDMKQYVVKIETTSEIIWCRNCPMSICERKVIKTKVAGKLFARKEEVLVFTCLAYHKKQTLDLIKPSWCPIMEVKDGIPPYN